MSGFWESMCVCMCFFLEPFIVSHILIPCLYDLFNLCYSYRIIGMFRIKLSVNVFEPFNSLTIWKKP